MDVGGSGYDCVRDLKAVPAEDMRGFRAVLLFQRATVRRARNGSEFLVAELGDNSGSFSTTCFSDTPSFLFFREATEGTIVEVEGQCERYQGKFSPRITAIRELTEDEVAEGGFLSRLVEVAPEPADAMWAELLQFVEEIPHAGLRATTKQVLEDIGERFRTAPAAVSMHHAYRHGLLEHTLHMARACKALLPLYPEVDPSLAMAGTILHDTGKTVEYGGNLAVKKTRKGLLQGHVVLGYRLVRKAAIQCKLDEELVERLEHIVLSHQGELEWGAAVMAATPEAVFVSMVDNLDARMGMVQAALRRAGPQDEFSDYLPGLKASLCVRGLASAAPAAGSPTPDEAPAQAPTTEP